MRWHHADLGPVSPGPVHPGGRGMRPDPPAGRAGAARGLPPGPAVVRARLARRPHRGQPVAGPVRLPGPDRAREPDPATRPASPARCLELEITEGMLMATVEQQRRRSRRLHRCGVPLALDDFGIGYSSLPISSASARTSSRSTARSSPPAPGSRATRRSRAPSSTSARPCSLKVLAEGVETKDQRDFLLAAGCDEVQGYLFARPLPAAEVDALLPAAHGFAAAG